MSDKITPEEDFLYEQCERFMITVGKEGLSQERNAMFRAIMMISRKRGLFELKKKGRTAYPSILDYVREEDLKLNNLIYAVWMLDYVTDVLKVLRKKESNMESGSDNA